MHTPDRLDSLEAGIHFMAWLLSDHSLFASKPEGFFASLGMNWDEVVAQCRESDREIAAFVDAFEARLAPSSPFVFHWFELGRRTVFIADLAGTGAPPEVHNQAIAGYRTLLSETTIDEAEQEGLASSVRDVADGPLEEKGVKLQAICDELRRLASVRSPEHTDRPLWSTPGMATVLYVAAALIVGAILLSAAQILPPLLPVIVASTCVVGVAGIGAAQLRGAGGRSDKPLLDLLGQSLAQLPFLPRGGDSKQDE